eukprot:1158426-Pelagomonas_calceolata.AAC.6
MCASYIRSGVMHALSSLAHVHHVHSVAIALLGDPKVVYLDEPTTGAYVYNKMGVYLDKPTTGVDV